MSGWSWGRRPTRGLCAGVAVVCVLGLIGTFRPDLFPEIRSLFRSNSRELNLLVITLDTTRADAIGTFGGPAITPTLDYLARTGVAFEQAATVAPLTLPAHSSLFTGLFPPGHHAAELRCLRKSTPFWKILGDHGIWSTILRVPVTFPPDRFNGAELSAMTSPWSARDGQQRCATIGDEVV